MLSTPRRYTPTPILFPAFPAANKMPKARIAEEAGASAVMALERVPADIRVEGGVSRMSDPKLIKEIMEAVTIPVMAKARIGHFVECQVSFLLHPPPLPPPPPSPPTRPWI